MILTHPTHPTRRLRLGYCLNLHAADDVDGLVDGLRAISVPLRARLAPDADFGVGMYLPGALAVRLALPEFESDLERLGDFLEAERLVPFTFNAFPFGGFQTDGLKEKVYAPSWFELERVAYTVAVGRCAAVLGARFDLDRISISTHPGSFGAWIESDAQLVACARNMARALLEFDRIEKAGGARLVLSLEAEPRASAGDSTELAAFMRMANAPMCAEIAAVLGAKEAARIVARHFAVCLDTCHSAIAFEEPDEALGRALGGVGAGIGKIQFSSALALASPGERPAEVAALLALDEPRFLHQVTGEWRGADETGGGADSSDARLILGVADLPELRDCLCDVDGDAAPTRDAAATSDAAPTSDAAARERWLACSEWRCHFHVPIDRGELPVVSSPAIASETENESPCSDSIDSPRASAESVTRSTESREAGDPAPALGTTRAHADRILTIALSDERAFDDGELHVEIETYTWDVLPGSTRDAGALVDGLEREYRSLLATLETEGWSRT